jgi:hypothetical protein
MAEGFLIGEGVRNKLKETFRVVDAMQGGGNGPTSMLRTTFDEPSEPTRFRIGTFGTAAWSIGTDNTVTLTNVGVTGYTVLATNVFGSLPAATATQACAVAKDGTAWYLIQPFGSSLVRRGTFNSPWATSETKTITLLTGGTVAASNTLINYPAPPAGKSSVNCAVGNEGGTWFLVSYEFVTATALIVASMNAISVVTDIAISASLNTSSCAITIGKTSTTALVSMVGSTYTTTIIRLV